MEEQQIIEIYQQARRKYGPEATHKAFVSVLDMIDHPLWKKRFLDTAQGLSRDHYDDGRQEKQSNYQRNIGFQINDWELPIINIDLGELVTLKRVLQIANPKLLEHVIDDVYAAKQNIRRWRQQLRERMENNENDHN